MSDEYKFGIEEEYFLVDAETKQFVSAMTDRLTDLSAAVTAAENMPTSNRRTAHTAISDQLDAIDADLMARLGVA